MKSHKKLAIPIFALIAIGFLLTSFSTEEKVPKTQICYGGTIETESMHNSPCIGIITKDYACFGQFKFRKYILSVSAPDGWYFTDKKAYVNCVQDNEGSFGWNAGYFNRILYTQSTPSFREIVVYVSSRSIKINLACEAEAATN